MGGAGGVSIRGPEIPMLVGVGVTAKADGVGVGRDRGEEIGVVDIGDAGFGPLLGAQRDVVRDHDQVVARHVGQHIADEGQLVRPEMAAVLAEAVGAPGVGPQVFDVIQHEERHAGILERAVASAEHALERLARVGVVRGLQIHVVVARAVIPGQPDGADDAVEPIVIGQVVEHQVAMGDAERGLDPGGGDDDIVADVADLGDGFRLRVGEQQGVERRRLVLLAQREVDRGGQRTGWRDAGKPLPQIGRALRHVQVGEAGELSRRVNRSHVAGGLDDEHAIPSADGYGVAPIRIGLHDVAPVGNHDAGHAAPGAVQILEYRAIGRFARGLRGGPVHPSQCQPRRRGEGLPPCHAHHRATILGPFSRLVDGARAGLGDVLVAATGGRQLLGRTAGADNLQQRHQQRVPLRRQRRHGRALRLLRHAVDDGAADLRRQRWLTQ